jgi:hypothetical protein
MVHKVEDKRIPMTITVKESIQKRLKIYASDNGISMSRVIEELVDKNISDGFKLSFEIPVDVPFMTELLKNEVSHAVSVMGMMNFDRKLSYYNEVALIFPTMIRESLSKIARKFKDDNGKVKKLIDENNNGRYQSVCELDLIDDIGVITVVLRKNN